MRKKYLLIFCLFFIGFLSIAKPLTDEEYERHIYNIYLKHYKDPVSNSDWNEKIKSLSKNYKLKFKDNLWDLSGSFFKNSLYWSKLWVVNPQVENPHLIYKGDFLKLDVQDLVSVNTSKYSVDIQSQFPGLVVPPQESIKGALKEADIPSSLPYLLDFYSFDFEIDIDQLKHVEVHREVILPFYLTESPPSQVGEVIGKDGYGTIAGLGSERIVVRVEGDVSIGDTFTVFKNRGKVDGFLKSLIIDEEEIAIKGKIKILSYVSGAETLYLASVLQPLQGIVAGDILFKGEPQVYTFSRKGPQGENSGKIIGSPTNRLFLSLGSIVYLDKGLNSGVQAGNIFYIKANSKKNLDIERPYKYDLPVIGELKIIHSATDRSTGVIVTARDYIHVGDIFSGKSDQLQDLSQSIEHEELETQEEKPPTLNTEEQIPPGVEKIEDYDTIENGKDLLLDYEEIGEEESGGMEDLENLEEEPDEDKPETITTEDVELEVEGEVEGVEPEDLEIEWEDPKPLENIERELEAEDEDSEDLELEEEFEPKNPEETLEDEASEDLGLEEEFESKNPEETLEGEDSEDLELKEELDFEIPEETQEEMEEIKDEEEEIDFEFEEE